MPDPLAPLLDLPGVADAAAGARKQIDQLFGHQVLRRNSGPVSVEAALRGAHASASLEGARYDLEAVRAGAVTDPVVQGSLRIAGAIGSLVDTWPKAPLQVLARLHVLAARDTLPPDALGRPRTDPEVAARLAALGDLVTGGTDAPAVILAAIVHGELLALAPFDGPGGLVARAAARLTLIAKGLDPKAVSVPEIGHLAREPEYIGAANAYATGTSDGVRNWLQHCCTAVALGADEGFAICEAMSQ
ncbi:oxidoreductase [Cryptosporangium phraense]|uniref:Oxidoreductase n=1 Tax=Cryptosporangium phraense TaxID=2593070 RepID=A0A545ARG5_9ACTN|nr:oxidoreductase [Cryptosporangium phraense]TQS43841.1 oxidoreductase [Cryptosporangium phraense]